MPSGPTPSLFCGNKICIKESRSNIIFLNIVIVVNHKTFRNYEIFPRYDNFFSFHLLNIFMFEEKDISFQIVLDQKA